MPQWPALAFCRPVWAPPYQAAQVGEGPPDAEGTEAPARSCRLRGDRGPRAELSSLPPPTPIRG